MNATTTHTPDARYLITPAVGDYLAETLWTDTRVYRVIKVTKSTITIIPTTDTGKVHKEHRDGNPYPVVWNEVTAGLDDPNGWAYTLRRRKDGTFRNGNTANPLRAATLIDGQPVRYTDYRF